MTEVLSLQLKSLSARHREFCRLIVRGATGREIMEKLGYSESRVSVLKNDPLIQSEIERLEDRLFEEDLNSRLKNLGPIAIGVLEDVLTSNDPSIKPHVKREAATWVVEKLTGKPRGEINVESNSLTGFMDLIKQMQERGEGFDTATIAKVDPVPLIEDSTQKSGTDWDKWLDENIPNS